MPCLETKAGRAASEAWAAQWDRTEKKEERKMRRDSREKGG